MWYQWQSSFRCTQAPGVTVNTITYERCECTCELIHFYDLSGEDAVHFSVEMLLWVRLSSVLTAIGHFIQGWTGSFTLTIGFSLQVFAYVRLKCKICKITFGFAENKRRGMAFIRQFTHRNDFWIYLCRCVWLYSHLKIQI